MLQPYLWMVFVAVMLAAVDRGPPHAPKFRPPSPRAPWVVLSGLLLVLTHPTPHHPTASSYYLIPPLSGALIPHKDYFMRLPLINLFEGFKPPPS
jgi:hypothetical protein